MIKERTSVRPSRPDHRTKDAIPDHPECTDVSRDPLVIFAPESVWEGLVPEFFPFRVRDHKLRIVNAPGLRPFVRRQCSGDDIGRYAEYNNRGEHDHALAVLDL